MRSATDCRPFLFFLGVRVAGLKREVSGHLTPPAEVSGHFTDLTPPHFADFCTSPLTLGLFFASRCRSVKMSRKRVASDTLTGGTRDVNPQTLGMGGDLTESAAATFTSRTVAVPVNRVSSNSSVAQVIEVLWVEFEHTSGTIPDAANETFSAALTMTEKAAMPSLGEVDLIAKASWGFTAFVTSGGAGGSKITHIDLTDGQGHGIIVATPNVFFAVAGENTATAQSAGCRMGYRFKNVGLQEYVGLAIQFGQ